MEAWFTRKPVKIMCMGVIYKSIYYSDIEDVHHNFAEGKGG